MILLLDITILTVSRILRNKLLTLSPFLLFAVSSLILRLSFLSFCPLLYRLITMCTTNGKVKNDKPLEKIHDNLSDKSIRIHFQQLLIDSAKTEPLTESRFYNLNSSIHLKNLFTSFLNGKKFWTVGYLNWACRSLEAHEPLFPFL
jgi:hypothetical protein